MKKVEIQVPEGKRAEWVNAVLTLVDDKPKDVMERIKTFDDACKELGEEHEFVKHWRWLEKSGPDCRDIIAYFKLRIIVAALNEGWEPQFTKDEYRYFPWFYFYTEEEIENMCEENKQNLFILPSTADYGGVAFADAHYDSSSPHSSFGSRLAFKNSELAKYAGKRFIEIWADYIYLSQSQNR